MNVKSQMQQIKTCKTASNVWISDKRLFLTAGESIQNVIHAPLTYTSSPTQMKVYLR